MRRDGLKARRADRSRPWWGAVAAAMAASLLAAPVLGADSAVVFTYHRVGDDRYPSTNTTLTQFDAHLGEVERSGLVALPLERIVQALRRRDTLPERAIAFTIDDAFASVYRNAWPRLRKAGIPATLFVATDAIDQRRPDYMTWNQIREMAAGGVGIGSQTAGHPHLTRLGEEDARDELARSIRRIREELGFAPTLLAYPFGEYGLREKRLAREAGFQAAFGQHSGVAHAEADLFGLPRFAMNVAFGQTGRFRLAANALPLYLEGLRPVETVLDEASNPPTIGFRVAPRSGAIDALRCYASNAKGAAPIRRVGPREVEIGLSAPFRSPRGRINCTMPAGDDRWRWFGLQFVISP